MAWPHLADSLFCWYQWKATWNKVAPPNSPLFVPKFISPVSNLSPSHLRAALQCCCGEVSTALHKLSSLAGSLLSFVLASLCSWLVALPPALPVLVEMKTRKDSGVVPAPSFCLGAILTLRGFFKLCCFSPSRRNTSASVHVFPACKVLFSAEPVPLLVGPPFCLKHKLQDKYSIYINQLCQPHCRRMGSETGAGWRVNAMNSISSLCF